MCKKSEPKSSKEEIENFIEKLRSVLKDAPEDFVMLNLVMLDPGRHDRGPAIVAVSGSSCALNNLLCSGIDKVPDLKEIFETAVRSHSKESRHPLSLLAEMIANHKDRS